MAEIPASDHLQDAACAAASLLQAVHSTLKRSLEADDHMLRCTAQIIVDCLESREQLEEILKEKG